MEMASCGSSTSSTSISQQQLAEIIGSLKEELSNEIILNLKEEMRNEIEEIGKGTNSSSSAMDIRKKYEKKLAAHQGGDSEVCI